MRTREGTGWWLVLRRAYDVLRRRIREPTLAAMVTWASTAHPEPRAMRTRRAESSAQDVELEGGTYERGAAPEIELLPELKVS